MRHSFGLKIAITFAVMTAGAAQAATFNEPASGVGDSLNNAGDTTANFVDNAVNPLDTITGRVSTGSDMFKIQLNSASLFTATAFGATNPFNPQLFLFDSSGAGLFANDDAPANASNAEIQASLQAGIYFLGISKSDSDPLNSAGQEIFPDSPITGLVTPSGANPIFASWSGGPAGVRSYQIDLSATSAPTSVPTPALLPGLLAFGAGIVRKRRESAAA